MNKIFKPILIISLAVLGTGFLAVLPVNATPVGPLFVQFENTPLFQEANFVPGDGVTRWIKVTNNSGETKKIAIETINESDPDNFTSKLDITIKESATTLYSGTLKNFFDNGETYLSELASSATTQYDLIIAFNSSSGNEYQGKQLGFDLLVGFQGTEGTNDGNGGGGGGGGLPPGLTITNETEINIQTTSVTITWLTNYNSTSQVIYGLESENHTLNLSDNAGSPPNYGYAHTTSEYDLSPKISFHSVTITGLTPGTNYYYRAVSHASLAIGQEFTFTTLTSTISEEEEGGEPFSPASGEENKLEEPGTLAGGAIAGEEGGNIGELSQNNKIVTGAEGETPSTLFSSLLATMGNLFNLGNLCWILIILIIVLIALLFLSDNKKTSEEKKKQRAWVLPLIIVLLIILYYFLCPNCLYPAITFVVLFILCLLFRRKFKK